MARLRTLLAPWLAGFNNSFMDAVILLAWLVIAAICGALAAMVLA